MSVAQRAMAVAMIYPDAEHGGDGGRGNEDQVYRENLKASVLPVSRKPVPREHRLGGGRPVAHHGFWPVLTMATQPINDDYVITSRSEAHRWNWEIRRKSKPLGIKVTGVGYQSDTAARFADKRALADFLSDLSMEEGRQRK